MKLQQNIEKAKTQNRRQKSTSFSINNEFRENFASRLLLTARMEDKKEIVTNIKKRICVKNQKEKFFNALDNFPERKIFAFHLKAQKENLMCGVPSFAHEKLSCTELLYWTVCHLLNHLFVRLLKCLRCLKKRTVCYVAKDVRNHKIKKENSWNKNEKFIEIKAHIFQFISRFASFFWEFGRNNFHQRRNSRVRRDWSFFFCNLAYRENVTGKDSFCATKKIE